MTAIIKKEMKTYFNNMSGYVFLFFFVILTAAFFMMTNVLQLNAEYYYTTINSTMIFMVMIPMLTMRLFAEEYAQKTDQLLYTAPVPTASIVVGKYVSACTVLLIGMVITGIFPCLISPYATLPLSRIIGTYVGFFLLGCSFISIGMLVSVMTNNQIIAAVASFALIFVFYMADSVINIIPATREAGILFVIIVGIILSFFLYNSTKNIGAGVGAFVIIAVICAIVYATIPNVFDGLAVKSLKWVSLMSRFQNFSIGILDVADIVYYITFSMLFNFFTVNVIEKRRWA
ncbi:ABC transporter permease subunit [Tyzzerella sp. OttesenSCG-928-J15]|nr:ABC transporter permease subunit [Tyzzerella sp. OttesenSCG-928-J15]